MPQRLPDSPVVRYPFPMPEPMPMLSGYPDPKIKVACDRCPITAQYDVQAMLKAGGDRRLLDLLDQIKERVECPRHPPEPGRIHNLCGLRYANLIQDRANLYAKISRG